MQSLLVCYQILGGEAATTITVSKLECCSSPPELEARGDGEVLGGGELDLVDLV